MKKMQPLDIYFFITLGLGFLTTEFLNNPASFILLLILLALASLLQNRIFGSRFIAYDRLIARRSLEDEQIYYRGSFFKTETREIREKRYLGMTYNLPKQSSIRFMVGLLALAFGACIYEVPELKLTLTSFLHFVGIVSLISIASQNHKLIPLTFSALAVTFGLFNSSADLWFAHGLYVFFFFATCLNFKNVQTAFKKKDTSQLKVISICATAFILIFLLSNALVPEYKTKEKKLKPHGAGQGGFSQSASASTNQGENSSPSQRGSGGSSSSGSSGSTGSSEQSGSGGSPEGSAHGSSSESPANSGQGQTQTTQPEEQKPSNASVNPGQSQPQGKTSSQTSGSGENLHEKIVNKIKSDDLSKLKKYIIWILVLLLGIALFRYFFKKKNSTQNKLLPQLTSEERDNLINELKLINSKPLSIRDQIIKKYHLFLKLMDSAKSPKEKYLPPIDYLTEINSKFPTFENQFTTMTETFSDTLYGEMQVQAPEFQNYEKAFKSILKTFLRVTY